MDVSEVKERLLEAVRNGETIVMFGEAIKASVSPQGDVYKVEVTGFHPVGFPRWDEDTSVASWEGPEVDEAAKRVVDAMAGIPAKMMQEAAIDVVVVTKPIEVTENYIRIRQRDPKDFEEKTFKTVALSEEQGIKAVMGRLKGEETMTIQSYLFDAGKWEEDEARKWLKEHKVKKKEIWEAVEEEIEQWALVEKVITEEPGEIVIYSEDKSKVLGRFPYGKGKKYADKDAAMEAAKKRLKQIEFFKRQGKEADLRQALEDIERAFMEQAPGGEANVAMVPWVEKIFDTYLIVRDADEKYYQVSYTRDEAKGPQFASRTEWIEVEQVWSPKLKEGEVLFPPPHVAFWQKEPTAKMFLAVAKAFLQRRESETTVWKEGDKRYYLGLVSLPSIKDREGEVVTAEGADFSIDLAKRFGYRSGLYIKHVVPQSIVGRMISERRIGPFWVEFGEFKNTPLADRAFHILENDKEGKWRFSIGFITPERQAIAGRYTRLLKFDSTITEVPAQPLTAMLALMKEGGKVAMDQSVQKLMTFLNPETDDDKAQWTEMLSDLFEVEEKELVTVAKQTEDIEAAKAVIEALEDGDLKKALSAALDAYMAAPPEGDEEKKKKKKELEDLVAVVEPISAQIKALSDRVAAVEASAGSAALKELRDVLLTRSKDYVKPVETAPVVLDGAEILKQLEKIVNPGSTGKHPLASFAGGPSAVEGG